MIKMKKIKKKGQEEIVGFVVIIVLVAVVFLVILGLYMNKRAPVTQKESRDVEQFLTSAMEYTSECKIWQSEHYFSLGELFRECHDQTICDSGEDSCSMLKRTLEAVIGANWPYGDERPVKGYIFNSTYLYDSNSEEVLFMDAGNCTTESVGAEYNSPDQPGIITSSLVICS